MKKNLLALGVFSLPLSLFATSGNVLTDVGTTIQDSTTTYGTLTGVIIGLLCLVAIGRRLAYKLAEMDREFHG